MNGNLPLHLRLLQLPIFPTFCLYPRLFLLIDLLNLLLDLILRSEFGFEKRFRIGNQLSGLFLRFNLGKFLRYKSGSMDFNAGRRTVAGSRIAVRVGCDRDHVASNETAKFTHVAKNGLKGIGSIDGRICGGVGKETSFVCIYVW